MTSFRVIYVLSIDLNMLIESINVDVAFLNASLKEDGHIEPPDGYSPVANGLVLKLKKALYKLKQSLMEWSEMLNTFLQKEIKMTRVETEQCIYVRFNENRSECFIVAVSVDDSVIAGTTQGTIKSFKQQITTKYECEDLDELNRILNRELTHTVEGGLSLSLSLSLCQGCVGEI